LHVVSLVILLKYLSLCFRYFSVVVWSAAKRVCTAVFRSFSVDNLDIVVYEELGVVYLSYAEFVRGLKVGDILMIGVDLGLELGP
jgi:hypothetical protein